jgi:hypothetical protein
MRQPRLIIILVTLALCLAGCGGSSAGPDGTSPDDGGAPSAEPGSGGDDGGNDGGNDGGDDGGGGDIITGDGSAHYEVSGDVTTSGDLAFIDLTSTFDDAAGQAYLTFSNGGDEVLVIVLDRDGGSAVQFGNPEIAISPTPLGCTFDIRTLDGSNAAGSFDCQNQLAVKGEQIATASIKGTFEAHK